MNILTGVIPHEYTANELCAYGCTQRIFAPGDCTQVLTFWDPLNQRHSIQRIHTACVADYEAARRAERYQRIIIPPTRLIHFYDERNDERLREIMDAYEQCETLTIATSLYSDPNRPSFQLSMPQAVADILPVKSCAVIPAIHDNMLQKWTVLRVEMNSLIISIQRIDESIRTAFTESRSRAGKDVEFTVYSHRIEITPAGIAVYHLIIWSRVHPQCVKKIHDLLTQQWTAHDAVGFNRLMWSDHYTPKHQFNNENRIEQRIGKMYESYMREFHGAKAMLARESAAFISRWANKQITVIQEQDLWNVSDEHIQINMQFIQQKYTYCIREHGPQLVVLEGGSDREGDTRIALPVVVHDTNVLYDRCRELGLVVHEASVGVQFVV